MKFLKSSVCISLFILLGSGCAKNSGNAIENGSISPGEILTSAAKPTLVYTSSAQKMVAGVCTKAVTVQAQDGAGHPVVQKSALNVAFSYNANYIEAFPSWVNGYSDPQCKNLLPNGGPVGHTGYEGFAATTIPAGSSSVSVYFIANRTIFMDLAAASQNYVVADQTEDVVAAAPVGINISGPDTLGVGKCSHAYWVRALDAYSNPANVKTNVTVSLKGLGSVGVYSDANCTKAISNGQITLKPSTTTFSDYGGPSSDVPFYLKASSSGNYQLTAAPSSLSFLYGVNLWVTPLANSGAPIPPQNVVTLPPRPSLSGSNVIHVGAGGDLQGALNSAAPGDVIELQAGATYGAVTLPPKTNPGKEYITITSSNLSKLPAQGTRVNPATDAKNMPKIVTSNIDWAIQAPAAQGSTPAASYYRLIGVEVTMANTAPLQYLLIDFTGLSQGQTILGASTFPHNLFIESSYIHGNSAADLDHCIAAGGVAIGIFDSYVSDCHAVGTQASAIGSHGPGPYTIQNNYIESWLIFGGAPAYYPNEVSTDIVISHNTFARQIEWNPHDKAHFKCVMRNGQCQHWTVTNMLELKEARRVRVEGNILAYNWVDAQAGMSILITPRAYGTGYFTIVEDVSYTNNLIVHAPQAFEFGGQDSVGPAHGLAPERVLVQNNALYDIGNAIWGAASDTSLLQTAGFDDLNINHNTIGFSNTANFWAMGTPAETPTGVYITNNIVTCGAYAFHGVGITLDTYPNLTMKNNVFSGCSSTDLGNFASSNYLAANPLAIDFQQYSADAEMNDSDILALKSTSKYYHILKSDPVGLDPGVNWTSLTNEIKGLSVPTQ